MQLFKHNQPHIEISSFVPYQSKEGRMVPGVKAKTTYLYDELYKFKTGFYIMLIENLRSLKTKEDKTKYKLESLPAFTFSCHFKTGDYRKQTNIKNLTNLICFDLDFSGAYFYIGKKKETNPNYSIEDLRDEIYDTIPCVFCGLSCTGTGIFFIVKYNDNEHIDCFNDVYDLFKEKYNIELDAACKDYGRLRFATYDPNAHITDWKLVKPYELRKEYLEKKHAIEAYKRKEQNKIIVHHRTDVGGMVMERAVNLIKNAVEGERHLKIRSAARLLGGYIATNFLDEGYVKTALIEAVHDIRYDDIRDAENTINSGIENGKLYPIEINVITPDDPQFAFFVEQDEARQRDIQNLYVSIRESLKAGVPITALDYVELGSQYFIDIDRVRQIAYRIYEKFSYEFNVNNKPTIAKVEVFLTGKYEFRRDIITGIIQMRYVGTDQWREIKYEDIWRDILQANFRFKFDDVVRLFKSSYVEEVNVWDDYFKKIPYKDDGIDHIFNLANYIACKDPAEQIYFAEMFKKMLVRTVKCALDDFYANRTVFVLASETQSNGKSSFIRWLNPFGPHLYYAENPLEDNKDSRIRLSETFIYNLEELATISKFEINRLKAIISQIGTRDRKPYGRQAENIIRRCSFFGSTNKTSFLTDDKNTRWLCFEIESIDWSYNKEIDKDMVWGQAYNLYKSGYDCELNKIESETRDNTNVKFQVTSVEADLIEKYFEKAYPRAIGAKFLTSTSIFQRLLLLTKESRLPISNVWVGRALSYFGYQRQRHHGIYGYWVYPKNHPQYMSFEDDNKEGEENTNKDDYYTPPF